MKLAIRLKTVKRRTEPDLCVLHCAHAYDASNHQYLQHTLPRKLSVTSGSALMLDDETHEINMRILARTEEMFPVFSDSRTKLMTVLVLRTLHNILVSVVKISSPLKPLQKPRSLAKRAVVSWFSCRMDHAKALPPRSTIGLIPPRGTSLIYPPFHKHCFQPTTEIQETSCIQTCRPELERSTASASSSTWLTAFHDILVLIGTICRPTEAETFESTDSARFVVARGQR